MIEPPRPLVELPRPLVELPRPLVELVETTPLHFGALHPYELALTLLLAFGPFVALAILIVVRRRQHDHAEAEGASETDRP